MHRLLQSLHSTTRLLLKSPGFTVTADSNEDFALENKAQTLPRCRSQACFALLPDAQPAPLLRFAQALWFHALV
jgi:hypothetical protein